MSRSGYALPNSSENGIRDCSRESMRRRE